MTDTGGTDNRDAAGWSTGPPPGGQAPPQGYPPPGGHPAPYGGGYGYRQPIDSHLAWGIVTTLLCCMPFGIVSIVYASQVNGKQAVGNIAGAMAASRNAKTWAIVSAVTGAGLIVLYLLAAVVFGFAGAFTAGVG